MADHAVQSPQCLIDKLVMGRIAPAVGGHSKCHNFCANAQCMIWR
jgi:hypothetical protein